MLVVFANHLLFHEFLDVVNCIPANIAYGDAARFGFVTHQFDHVLTTLFGQQWQRHANHDAGRRRVQSQIRILYRLLDRLHHAFFPGGNRQRSRVFYIDIRALVKRHFAAVILDRNVVEQTGMRAAGA